MKGETGKSGIFSMRVFLALTAFVAVAACSPTVPDSGPASREAQRTRDAALANPELPSPYAISDESTAPGPPLSAITTSTDPNADIAAQTTAALAATDPEANGATVEQGATGTSPTQTNSPGISSENDFEVVSAEQTIESDAARLEQNRAQYQIIQPTELPTRAGSAQPNVVAFALQTSNPVGTKIYKRSGGSQAKFERNCAKYTSSDQAQVDFLKSGGPEKDRKGIDPDGDGYACSWDPTPFRAAVNN